MEITLGFLLIIYYVAVAALIIFAFFNLFHVLRNGHLDAATYFITGLFVAGFILILFVSYVFVSGVDWTSSIHLFDGFNSNIPSTTL